MHPFTNCCKKLFLFIFLAGAGIPSFAQAIRGKVTDGRTGEPLAGATVTLEHTRYAVVVNLDGSFVFKNIPPGEYLISSGGNPDLANDPNALTIQVKVGETTDLTIQQHARVTEMGVGGRRISPIP